VKISMLIRSLEYGGTERQLVNLARGLAKRGHDVRVLVFYAGGPFTAELVDAGVPVVDLRKSGRWDVARFFGRLVCSLQEAAPDVLYSALGSEAILNVLVRLLIRKGRVVWRLSASNMDLSKYDWVVRRVDWLQRRLASQADLIIANSVAGRDYAVATGFPAARIRIIPNGIDTEKFRPDAASRAAMRHAWGIAPTEKLVGLIARLDPMKDHPNFLRAAAMVSAGHPEARFVCVGEGSPEDVRRFQRLAADLQIGKRTLWVGAQGDMPAVYNALDLVCLSSITEGLPNVLCEAMACGVLCVSTNVGDAARVLGDLGTTVPVRHPEAMATAIGMALNRHVDPAALRQRIERNYSIDSLVTRTVEAFAEAVKISA
jgi:glycosyltransferase involved in cell wall biosynthesis